MSRKSILVSIVFISLAVIIMLNTNKRIETNEHVINLIDDKVIKYMNEDIKDLVINPNDFNSFYLLFDTYQLSSKNIDNLFKYYKDNDYEYQIEAIYPYINPLYEDKLSKVKEIIFGGNTLLSGINNFIITYINELNKNKLDGEVDRVNASGISIRMIKINTSNQSMFEFLKKYSNIKYNLSSTGIFKTF